MYQFFIWIACQIIGVLTAKKPAGVKDSGTWTQPTAEEGRCVPIVLGTVRLRSPNCLWWGDLLVKAIKTSTGGFLGIGAKKVTTGHKYYVGMMQGLCTKIDAVEDVVVGEKSMKAAGVAFPWEYGASGSTKAIDLENLFGGEDSEGGLKGTLSIYFGSDTQEGDGYLTSKWGVSAPGYRGMCYAVLQRFYIGTSKYLKTWEWVVRHCPCPGPMNSAQANIGGSVNPAHGIAYLMLTDQAHGGMGESANLFDWSSFATAATTLYNEGFGISLQIDEEKKADAHLSEILQTIDATLFTDPQTGLWTLKLIRADYDPAELEEFGPSDIIGTPEVTRPTWPETLNRVVVRYISHAEDFTIRTVQDRDPANRIIQGVERCEVMDFFAVPTEVLALTVAARERHQRSYPVAGVILDLKRKAWSLRPGSVFLFTWPAQGISKMPCRVTTIKYGTLEAGRIHVEAVEDIFGVCTTAYSVPGASGWVNPISAPVAVTAQRLIEAPYALVGAERNVLALGTRGDETTEEIDVWSDEGNGYLYCNTMTPTPSGTLQADWSAKTAAIDSTGFTISGVDLDELPDRSTNADGLARGVNLLIVGNEWCAWSTATDHGDGTFTISGIMRGIFDTVPEDHAAGDRVWFLTEGAGLTQISSEGSGVAGLDGSAVLSGTTDPDSSIGQDGDFYINTVTHYLYGPKASGAWPAGISLVGPSASGWATALDLDFSAQASQTLSSDGNYTIDGKTWTKYNSTNDATAMAIVNGSGLVIVPKSTSDAWKTTWTTPGLKIPLQTLLPNVTLDTPLRMTLYVSSENRAANYDFAGFGLGNIANLTYPCVINARLGYSAGKTTQVVACSANVDYASPYISETANTVCVTLPNGISGSAYKLASLSKVTFPASNELVAKYRGNTANQAVSSLTTVVDWFAHVCAGRAGSATALSVTIARIKLEYLPNF